MTSKKHTITRFMPDETWIKNVEIGTMAPNCFGKMAKVVDVTAKQQDIKGNWFVCVNLQFGPNSTISQSFKTGELHRTVPLTNEFNSCQIDDLEKQIRFDLNIPYVPF